MLAGSARSTLPPPFDSCCSSGAASRAIWCSATFRMPGASLARSSSWPAPSMCSIVKRYGTRSSLQRCRAAARRHNELSPRLCRNADALDLPFQLDTGMCLDPRAHGFAERFDVGGGRPIEVDEEITVQGRDLRAPDGETATAGLIDQLPGTHAGRVLEGRAAGAVARLARLALRLDLGHLCGDCLVLAGAALKQRLGENDVVGHPAVTIGKTHLGIAVAARIALPVDAARLDQHDLGLAAIGAAVHAQRAADGSGDAAVEGQPGNAGIARGARHHDVEHRGACTQAMLGLDGNVVKAAAEADHDAWHTTVAHDEIGAGADDIDRKLRRQI